MIKIINIKRDSEYYRAAIDLRISLFFKGMENAEQLINDSFEKQSYHLVCVDEEEVLGTGRLHTYKTAGVISQMAVRKSAQNKGIGAAILKNLMAECSNLGLTTIKLSARKTAIDFYRKFDFECDGDFYNSAKTGIVHRNMSRKTDIGKTSRLF